MNRSRTTNLIICTLYIVQVHTIICTMYIKWGSKGRAEDVSEASIRTLLCIQRGPEGEASARVLCIIIRCTLYSEARSQNVRKVRTFRTSRPSSSSKTELGTVFGPTLVQIALKNLKSTLTKVTNRQKVTVWSVWHLSPHANFYLLYT